MSQRPIRPVAILALFVTAASQGLAQSAVYTTRDLRFRSGALELSGRLYAPVGVERYPVLVAVTGSGDVSVIGDDDTKALAMAFTAAGIGVLAYDKRGTGASTGVATGTDFRALGADAAAAIRFARGLPGVERVGVWGISQAGWVIPYALREKPGAAFAILVSPAGVNPHEQVTYFLHRQMRALGLSEAEASAADTIHIVTALYYASGRGYRAAQATVDRYRGMSWFHRVVTNRFWDDMTGEGRLFTPAELAAAVAKNPGGFDLYRSKSSFVDYSTLYESLTLPTLVIYGAQDELVPIDHSRAVIEPALRRRGSMPYQFRVFEGVGHDIQTPDHRLLPDYLDFIVGWARAH